MTCKELVELITDYLEDALPPPEQARFEAHLAGCPGCAIYLEQMRTTIRATGALKQDSIPPETLDELLNVFAAWKRSP